MASTKYNQKVVEEDVYNYWEKNRVYSKVKAKNAGGERFYFLQGPPYTSGRLHMGQAWNNSLKDMAMRYKRMKGFDVWDRAGYDMHGLPTSQKVMEQLGLKNKEQIEAYGLDKFSTECKKFSLEKASIMNDDLMRMAVWMDYENAYMPVKNSFIENVWWLVKTAWENDHLYLGKRTMSWCATHETALAKHEQEYKQVTDKSIYVKFQSADNEKEYFVIWTTTPWTIAFNLAIMVNPEVEYVRVNVDGETWILAEDLLESVMEKAGKEYEVVAKVKGEELAGLNYVHPWCENMKALGELKNDNNKVHTVVLSKEYVDTSAGTGLVHCAPGCGPEDYEVGHQEGLPPFNTVKEDGHLDETSGEFAGLTAKEDDLEFVQKLDACGALIATESYRHDYAHCERCHNPVIFRATSQWFFKVEDFKEQMLKDNEEIHWVPETGKNSFRSWLENLRDNSITKQRYWGTPFPLWECACGKRVVVGNAKELAEKALGEVPENLHKPWIDNVKLKCECGSSMERHPDVMDVWIDAGTASFNCLDYPTTEANLDLFPADFILEGKDQIRGWFNVLQVCSYLVFGKTSFRNVYMHGFITDVGGVKMSKSLGNVTSPYEITDKFGVDTMRYYLIGAPNAGVDINYDDKEIQTRYRHIGVLWNLHHYLIDLCKTNEFSMTQLTDSKVSETWGLEERYIVSRLHSTLQNVTFLMEQYRLDEAPDHIMDLVMDLSRTYIQLVREKSATGTADEKLAVVSAVYQVFMGALKMFCVVCPYVTDQMYLDLKDYFGFKEESIHLLQWDEVDVSKIDESLEEYMNTANGIIQATLAAREKAKLSVRWPVGQVTVVTADDKTKDACEMLSSLIMGQTNVKALPVVGLMPDVKVSFKADSGKIGQAFGALTPKIIAKLTSESEQKCLEQLDKQGKIILKVDGEEVELRKEHVKIEKVIPNHLKESTFKKGSVYLDTIRTDELEAEGYAREVMRRVQSFRKTSGLEKKYQVRLFIKGEDDLVGMLNTWKEQISVKVGAEQLMISSQDPSKEHEWTSEEKVKGLEFTLFMSKA
ncbi:MAG: isoleucine--tRNA ligase [Candidatus Nanoarchaeia archaeon]